MGHADTYLPGAWNFICDRCGRKFKSTEARKTWEGLIVCPRDWESRQPQDFVRAVPDKMSPPWTRPESADNVILFCTPNGTTALADFGVADCMIADYISPMFDPNITN